MDVKTLVILNRQFCSASTAKANASRNSGGARITRSFTYGEYSFVVEGAQKYLSNPISWREIVTAIIALVKAEKDNIAALLKGLISSLPLLVPIVAPFLGPLALGLTAVSIVLFAYFVLGIAVKTKEEYEADQWMWVWEQLQKAYQDSQIARLEGKAEDARDAKVDEIYEKATSNNDINKYTMVVAGYNRRTKQIAVFAKLAENGPRTYCAEDMVVEMLGGMSELENIMMTPPIRPRTLTLEGVCKECQKKYPRENFMPSTTFK